MFNDEKKEILKKVIFVSALCALGHCTAVEAVSPRRNVKEGNLLYKQGDYAASKEKYSEALEKVPESDIINFNLGTVLYKDEDYEKAIDHLQKSLLSEDDGLKKGAYYNLGNALYKFGVLNEENDISDAISTLEKSLSQYERAMEMEEDDDAKHNYEFVKKELARLQIKQQQQQGQGQQKKSDESKDQEGEGDQQQQQRQQQKGDEQQEQGKDQREQQGQDEQPQNQQEKEDQGRGQSEEEDYNKQKESGGQPQDAQELTQEEARMLLESYQQAEEPQGLLNVHPKS